ncbi:hypothetical protein GGI35DRAFT_355488 [Trichoderma velutinum]
MYDPEDSMMHKIEKGWSIAMNCSEERLKRIYSWTDDELSVAMQQGLVMLETVCVFVHGGVKSGQYKYGRLGIVLRYFSLLTLDVLLSRLPVDFWKMLHAEYGIVVYPSALTECVAPSGLGTSQTFAEIYSEHIGWSFDSRLCTSNYLFIDTDFVFYNSHAGETRFQSSATVPV